MNETEYIWMNGSLVPWRDAKIHVLTHTLHYGGGVFEGIRCYNTERGTAIFRLKDHTERFFSGAKTLRMKVPYSKDEINEAIKKTVRKNRVNEGYIRPLIYYGYGKMGLNPKGASINIAIAVWPWGAYLGEDAVNVKIPDIIRIHPQTTDTGAKITGNYANSILASLEIREAGYDEALLLDYRGNIAEGPGENFFIVKDSKLFTPPSGNVLSGITRDSIIKIAGDEGMEVEERVLTPSDVKDADEAFFTGTAAEITSIRTIDDVVIGDGNIGPITHKLRSIYLDTVRGKIERYREWLDLV
ncbi:MAG: branched-chain amino acid transaminase [Thermoplasmata archaeon]|nr:branched-chain amino acid transaminase [Thermoplasmata archaeon]